MLHLLALPEVRPIPTGFDLAPLIVPEKLFSIPS
jgi:hypothetical protein